jgi:hypothetical protein
MDQNRNQSGQFVAKNGAAKKTRLKPKGALRKVASQAELDSIVRNIVDDAINGDKESAFWVASRVAPPAKPTLQPKSFKCDFSSTETAARDILNAATSAQLGIDEANLLVQTLTAAANLTEIQAMSQRLADLEGRIPHAQGVKEVATVLTMPSKGTATQGQPVPSWAKDVIEVSE